MNTSNHLPSQKNKKDNGTYRSARPKNIDIFDSLSERLREHDARHESHDSSPQKAVALKSFLARRTLDVNFTSLKPIPIFYTDPNTGKKNTFSMFPSLRDALYKKVGDPELGSEIICHICNLANEWVEKNNASGRVLSSIIREECFLLVLDDYLRDNYLKSKPKSFRNLIS
jgi:hypothetical protein